MADQNHEQEQNPYMIAYMDYIISKKTADEVAKDLHIGRRKLIQEWNNLGLQLKKRGGQEKPYREDIVPIIHTEKAKFNLGYKKLFESYIHDEDVSYNDLRKIYEREGLFKFRREKEKEDKHPNQYVAKFVNQQWHTDLKSFKETINDRVHKFYLIAFIDDRSRYCIYFEILENKTMDSTSRALQNAIDYIHIVPYEVLSDNGTEFVGRLFQDVLKRNGIKHHRTEPYNPQLNGKVERFWQTIFSACNEFISIREHIPAAIKSYNEEWVHTSLKKLYGGSPRPKSVWDSEPKWNETMDPEPGFEVEPR